MLTRSDREWMDRRDELTDTEKEFLYSTMDEMHDLMTAANVRYVRDDRIASLEAAFIRYLIEVRT